MTRAMTALFWLSLVLATSLGLYRTSYQVEDMTRHLKKMNAQIAAEERAIHILKAEWVYLSNPARLEETARKHLDLRMTTPRQITRLDRLDAVLPTRSESASRTASFEHNARPAAHTPKAGAWEKDRLNTRMVLHKASGSYTMAHSDNEP